MAWDSAKPAGTQKLRLSDEEIRANWVALADALAREHIFPGTEGVDAGIHKTNVDTSAPSGYEGRLAIVNNLLQWYSNGAWRTLIPVGTKMLFYQASVPTGWTQDTSANDKVLRVTSGAGGGSGGDWTMASLKTGTQNAYVTYMVGSGSSAQNLAVNGHTHTMDNSGGWRPAYIDVIVGTKD